MTMPTSSSEKIFNPMRCTGCMVLMTETFTFYTASVYDSKYSECF